MVAAFFEVPDFGCAVDFFDLVADLAEAELALVTDFLALVDAEFTDLFDFAGALVEADFGFTTDFFDAVDFLVAFFAVFFFVFSVKRILL